MIHVSSDGVWQQLVLEDCAEEKQDCLMEVTSDVGTNEETSLQIGANLIDREKMLIDFLKKYGEALLCIYENMVGHNPKLVENRLSIR